MTIERPPLTINAVALFAFAGGTAVGMLSAAVLDFWLASLPVWIVVTPTAALLPVYVNARAAAARRPLLTAEQANVIFRGTFIGGIWGGMAGALAVSTCPGAHDFPFGPCAAGSVAMLMAAFLAMVEAEEGLPPALSRSNTHALCGVLYLLTAALAWALGAEVPAWH